MKFINNKFSHGGRAEWGLNYSIKDRRYGLILPWWFPFYARFSPEETFGEYISIVIPVVGVCLSERFSNRPGPRIFMFRFWRKELKRVMRVVSLQDLISFLNFHIHSLPSRTSLKKVTETIRELKQRGLSPEKIESALSINGASFNL